MSDTRDFSTLTKEELLKTEKELQRGETTSRFLIGFLIGVMIYGLVKGGFGWIYTLIPIFIIRAIYKHSQTQKELLESIQTELKEKNTSS